MFSGFEDMIVCFIVQGADIKGKREARPDRNGPESLRYMLTINPQDLVAMDDSPAPFRTALAYAGNDNLLFGEAIYRPGAKFWLHKILAGVVYEAARDCLARHGCRFILYDGLRTVEAQEAMLRTRRVRDNPHWITQKLLSVPGGGGHPRGMAVDIGLEDEGGNLLDMGTPFDFLAEDSSAGKNPAHRHYTGLPDAVNHNRHILTDTIIRAGDRLGVKIWALEQEWWDFRLMREFYELYAPLRDSDLPPEKRMTDLPGL
jgi:D-alanyl-D-alanine dipeptidase